MIYAISIILGYLLGSIPFALVIGLVFYKTDIRKHGSGNLGGTNAGRTLGKKAGIAVIACDAFKCMIPVGIIAQFSPEASIWCGLAACVGHCYPIFANFKGGKAAASMFGFLLAISIFTAQNWLCFLIPFGCFFITLYLSKMVSLSSMVAAVTSTISLVIIKQPTLVIVASFLLAVLIIYRHKDNIDRIKNGTERKITWM